MNKIANRILSFVVVLAMMLSTITVTFADRAKTIKVTMTIERFTIGQGFLVEPVTVEVKERASVKDVLEKVAQEKGVVLNTPAGAAGGYYLDSISYADTGELNIPEIILNMPDIEDNIAGYVYHYDAPSNTSTNALFEDEQKLGTGSYNEMAGWMYTLNNKSSDTGMDAQPVNDGDVVRVQFSLYGYGVDIGYESYYDNIQTPQLANKDKLIKQVAGVDAKGEYKDARAAAIHVLEKYDATQSEVDEALFNLGYVEETTTKKTEPTTAAPTTPKETTSVKLPRVTIKKLTNIRKYKVKIKINKIKKAKGYQYRYAKNRKFKNSRVKNTSKTIFTTKRLQKKVRCYVKVRAYVKVNGRKAFGRWSKVKSIKVKK